MKRPLLLGAFLALLLIVCAGAQNAPQADAPAIPMRDEAHHHLIFQNSYVNVFFVEIPPGESTLRHHHDLPYVSIQPGGDDAPPTPSGPPRIGYSAGNLTHVVTNSGKAMQRNIAVELVRPQGTVRDRCAAIIAGQTPQACEGESLGPVDPAKRTPTGSRTPLLETDEILVEAIEIAPHSAFAFAIQANDVLAAGLTGIQITGREGADSNVLRGGVLWLPAYSGAVFHANSDRGGRFIAITFKDSGRP